MPIKLNIGLSRKVGEANFGSRGASCSVEVEAEATLLLTEPAELQRRIQAAFDACRQAVDTELDRTPESGEVTTARTAGSTPRPTPAARATRPATSSQLRAIHAIASRHNVELRPLVQQRYHTGRLEELSITQASELIDELKSVGGAAP